LQVDKDAKLKPPFMIMPFMPGAKTTVKCAIGVVRQATTSKNATHSVIANTAYDMVMTGLTAFTPMTFATSTRTARSTLLTPTLSVATVLWLTMTLTSKGR